VEKQILIFFRGMQDFFWIVVFESSLQGDGCPVLVGVGGCGLVVVAPQSSGNVF